MKIRHRVGKRQDTNMKTYKHLEVVRAEQALSRAKQLAKLRDYIFERKDGVNYHQLRVTCYNRKEAVRLCNDPAYRLKGIYRALYNECNTPSYGINSRSVISKEFAKTFSENLIKLAASGRGRTLI